MILRHDEAPHHRITVPNHKEIAKGTLRAIINDAGLTIDQFLDLL
jgi:predicted RNA binding protein YcfA (HicA-like mRNA interferase family)